VNGLAGGAGAGERLGWAVFVAAAVHGMLILGVGFAPPPAGGPEEVPTLEVIMLDAPVPGQAPPEDAQYLAQASDHGAGNTPDTVRPEFHATPPAPQPETRPDRGADAELSPPAAEQRAAERISSWAGPLQAAVAPLQAEAEMRPAERPPDGGVTQVTSPEQREYFVSVAARESEFAEYLAGWRARMERLGTLNFPRIAASQRSGNPVLEVTVAADGRLGEVRVTRSSGQPELDQAAVDLVRLASPYDPFPPALRGSYDTLRFAYEWRFIDGRAGAGALRATPD
jgi:periplasmic protein TonB